MNSRSEALAIELGTKGAEILERVFQFIRRFVCLSGPQARVVALWVVHTHVFDSGDATPYLAITSAEKQSGKTRLLEVLATLVAKAWLTGRVSAAVLICKIHAQRPTLLLDESDAAFGGEKEYAEALRGVLNTGHRAGGSSSCCVGQSANISYQDFSTFCPKAIADVAGGEWPQVARRAIVELCAGAQAADDSIGKLLLADIRQIFDAQGVDKIGSTDLAYLLSEVETSPWGEWSQGKPLSAAKLARLLKPFEIFPHSVRMDDKTPKGYEREDFQDAFRRYLRGEDRPLPASPAFQSATPQQANAGAGFDDLSKCNRVPDVAASIWEKPSAYKPCCGVALSTLPTKAEEPVIEEDL
jgi:hypothetical protein